MKTLTTIRTMVLVAMLGLTTLVNAQDKIYLGVRVPQMTTAERANIGAESNPLNARGQLIFNTDTKTFQYWNGTSWVVVLDENKAVEVTGDDGTVRVVKDGTKFDLSVNIPAIADSLANYITNTILGDTVLNFIVNNIDNPTYNLGDTIMQYISNHFSDQLGDTILNYITNNFPGELGDTIINYITNNVTQELTDSIMAKVNITSVDKTVTINRTTPSDIDLSVNIKTVADSLSNYITNTILGDSILNYVLENIDVTNIGEVINEYLTNNFFNDYGDEILNYITNNFTDDLGDTILNYITNNVTQELVDSIMAKVQVIGKYGIEIEGSGTSKITVKLPEGQENDQILVWDNNAKTWKPTNQTKAVKQVTIAVTNGTFSTKNLTFYGTTSAASKALKVVSVEPVFSNVDMADKYLNVSATAQAAGNTAKWRVNIENYNFDPNKECTLQSVVISYICDDETTLSSDTQGSIERVGF